MRLFAVEPTRVSKEFDLPMSSEAMVAQQNGQTSLLLLINVPHLADKPRGSEKLAH